MHEKFPVAISTGDRTIQPIQPIQMIFYRHTFHSHTNIKVTRWVFYQPATANAFPPYFELGFH